MFKWEDMIGLGKVQDRRAVNPLTPAQQTDSATNWSTCYGFRLHSSLGGFQREQIKLWLKREGKNKTQQYHPLKDP
jgi:hypothetical protein